MEGDSGWMKIDVTYLKGSNDVNEDAYVVNKSERIFAVIDGATGLGGGLSGKLAADVIKTSLGRDNYGTLFSQVLVANEVLGDQVGKELGVSSVNDIPKYKRSSCGISAVRIVGNRIEYVHAGDCMLFVQYKDGTIRHVTYDKLFRLDEIALLEFKRCWDRRLVGGENPSLWDEEKITLTLKEIMGEIEGILKENRNKINEFDGYCALDGSEDVKEYLEYGFLSLSGVSKILLLTDGLQLISSGSDSFKVWDDTARFAFENGLHSLEKIVTSLEESDPACYIYPRFKLSDDKTGILINL